MDGTQAMRVAVLFGGPSPEHDVSILTGLQAARALVQVPGVTERRTLYWAKTGAFYEVSADLEAGAFAEGVPTGARPLDLRLGPEGGFFRRRGGLLGSSGRVEIDAVLVCCHGGPGEDGTLQGALDLAGLAYTGPSAAGAALGMDKLASAALLRAAGLPTLPRLLVTPNSKEPGFAGPYILKPRYGGSSIGIEVVADFGTALARLEASVHFRRGAVLEPYRPELYDLQVAVRTWPALELSAIERPLRRSAGAEILGYADKYAGGEGMLRAPRELPARIASQLAERVRALAGEAAAVLGARGVSRVDFLSDGEELFVNEINTIPGSLSRHLFIDPEVSFGELLAGLLAEARACPAAALSSAGADGSVLRSAGSIAAKLS
ncbi:MAG TPA: hypothetical protein VKV23_06375 [Acidimicrobiales bacterium]|nr:hypothetical protein [Acidimicrobiales bacterium]